jgi:hypothetical protein
MMLPASAGGNAVPVIAKLVQADEDTVRDLIHRFDEIGLACLDLRWAGGRPRLLSPDDEGLRRPDGHNPPDQARSAFHPLVDPQLAAHLRKMHGRVIRITREALRCLPALRGIWNHEGARHTLPVRTAQVRGL